MALLLAGQTEAHMRDRGEPPGQLVRRERAVVGRDGLDRGDAGVHGRAGLGVRQVGAQLAERSHPLLDVEPLQPAQPPLVGLRECVDLALVQLQRVALLQSERDLPADQGRQGGGRIVLVVQGLRGLLQQALERLLQSGGDDGRLVVEVAVDARPDDPRRRADLGKADGVEAAARNQLTVAVRRS